MLEKQMRNSASFKQILAKDSRKKSMGHIEWPVGLLVFCHMVLLVVGSCDVGTPSNHLQHT